MKQKTIALWMYRNEGGHIIQDELKRKLEEQGIQVVNDFDMRECYCLNGRVFTKDGFDLSSVDLLYHMNADEQTVFQNDILRALELSGVKIINSWNAFYTAKNKFMTNVLLKKHGINVPPSLFVNSGQAINLAEKVLNDWKKVLVKPVSRHGGKGILAFDDLEQFIDFIEATQDCFDSFYIEKLIPFEKHDYRIEIADGKVVGKYCRSKKHSYKTNTAKGGFYIPDVPDKECEKIALKASKVLSIESTIIDILKSSEDQEIYIIEVNPIIGVFTEVYAKFSGKMEGQEMFSSVKFDEVKLDGLLGCLLSSI